MHAIHVWRSSCGLNCATCTVGADVACKGMLRHASPSCCKTFVLGVSMQGTPSHRQSGHAAWLMNVTCHAKRASKAASGGGAEEQDQAGAAPPRRRTRKAKEEEAAAAQPEEQQQQQAVAEAEPAPRRRGRKPKAEAAEVS